MPSTSKRTTSGSSVSGPKVQTMECSGRTQRKEPGSREAAPQRMDFGQGKVFTMPGRISASTSGVARPGFSITAT
jgi:hypothetical protein